MERKPDIQYVGQFYVHGSEARELAKQQSKSAKTKLPLSRISSIQKVYVDPVALLGIVVAVVMLVVMVISAVRLPAAWKAHKQMEDYVKALEAEHTTLEHAYRSSYDLDDIAVKAAALGMIPVAEAETIQVSVTMPLVEEEPTWWDDLVWFFDGLIE